MRGIGVLLLSALCAMIFAPDAEGQSAVVLDTLYTPPGYEDGQLQATIYIPAAGNGVGAVLTHSYLGSRSDMRAWCGALASRGYVAMAIDYYDGSHSTYGVYPKPVRAFKTAVEFLRRNAGRFGITTGKIIGLGQSEGAMQWGRAVTWDNDDVYFQTDPLVDDHLDAVVLLYGLFDNNRFLQGILPLDQEMARFFAPAPGMRFTKGNCIANVARITTPVLLFHGTSDLWMPYQQSVQLHDSLRAYGKASQLVLLAGRDHLFDLTLSSPRDLTQDGLRARDTVLAFLNRMLMPTSMSVPGSWGEPRSFRLEEGYPNPFNSWTTLRYTVPRRVVLRLSVFNTLGQEVAVLAEGEVGAGSYRVQFEGSHLPSGLYFCRMMAEGYIQTRKVILTR